MRRLFGAAFLAACLALMAQQAAEAVSYCTPARLTPASSTTTYSCSAGGALSGQTCVTPATATTTTYPATFVSSSGYTCPSGGTLSGTTCTITAYSCASGIPSGTLVHHLSDCKHELFVPVWKLVVRHGLRNGTGVPRFDPNQHLKPSGYPELEEAAVEMTSITSAIRFNVGFNLGLLHPD